MSKFPPGLLLSRFCVGSGVGNKVELSYAVGVAVSGVVEGVVDSAASSSTTCAVGPAVEVVLAVSSSLCCNIRRDGGRVGSPSGDAGDCITAYVGGRTISDLYTGGANGPTTVVVGETVGMAPSVVVVDVDMALEML